VRKSSRSSRRGRATTRGRINRGKKSIVIDLKSTDGVALARDLAAKCDILIENYRPGVMDRLGLGYDVLSAANPGLIYCAISGFGMTGPLRDYPSFDIVTQAMSGAFSVNGERDHQRADRDFGGAV
jgi:crotonobetainyl-CoA:carnitine CoA-transferase CaiB-like acyl-CoA transferase